MKVTGHTWLTLRLEPSEQFVHEIRGGSKIKVDTVTVFLAIGEQLVPEEQVKLRGYKYKVDGTLGHFQSDGSAEFKSLSDEIIEALVTAYRKVCP